MKPILWAASCLALCLSTATAGESVVLVDFDRTEPGDGWSISSLSLSELTVPEDAPTSSRRALKLLARGGRGSIRRGIEVSDWRPFEAFAVNVSVEAAEPVEMRILALSGRGRSGMLKRFTLAPGPWRELVLPLALWRENFADRTPGFGEVSQLMIQWDAGEGAVTIDSPRLVPGERGNLSCRATKEDLLTFAFPEGGKSHESDNFLVLTDAKPLNRSTAKRLLRHLERGWDLLGDRYGLPEVEKGEQVPFFIFGGREDYEAFFPRFGERYGAGVNPPEAAAFSALGMAIAHLDPEKGWSRPILFRHAMHAAIQHRLGIAPNGNWVQSGLALATQIQIYPETMEPAALVRHFRTLAAGRSGFFLPLGELLGLKRPTSKNHAELMLFVEYLAQSRRDRLPSLWTGLAKESPALCDCGGEVLQAALEADLPALNDEFVAWGVKLAK